MSNPPSHQKRLAPKLLSRLAVWSMAVAMATHGTQLWAHQTSPSKNTEYDSNQYDIPKVADAASSKVSLEQEFILGQRWIKEFRKSFPTLDDGLTNYYLESLIKNLMQYVGFEERDFSLLIVDDKSINAFAVPGNVMGINTGLILQAETEGEVASVVAHELAHLSQRHYARAQAKGGSSVGTYAALIAILAALLGNASELATAAVLATGAAGVQSQISNTREFEEEADRVGLEVLLKAGYHPSSMSRMFALLSRNNTTELPQYLLTHPYSEVRQADVEAAVKNLDDRGRIDSIDFQLIKARLQEISSTSTPGQGLKSDPSFILSPVKMQMSSYKLAMTYANQAKYDKALKILNETPWSQGTDYYVNYLKAEILSQQLKYAEALKILENTIKFYGQEPYINMLYAKILLSSGRTNKAIDVIGQTRTLRPDIPSIWKLSANIHAQAGNVINYHKFQSTYLELFGRRREAVQHLNEALVLAQDDLIVYEALREKRESLLTDSSLIE